MLIKGRLSRADIGSAARSVKWKSDGWGEQTLTPDMVQMKYDKEGKYLRSTFGASTTGLYYRRDGTLRILVGSLLF